MNADLGQFVDNNVLPKLTAEQVFTHASHRWQKDGDKWRGGCPKHESQSGTSFYIDAPTLRWRCPACQVGGGPLQYLHWLATNFAEVSPRQKDFVDLARRCAEMVGEPFPERELTEAERRQAEKRETRRAILQAVQAAAEAVLWSERGKAALAYLASRGFSEDDCRSLGLGLYPTVAEIREAVKRAGHAESDARAIGVLNPKWEGYIVFPWADEYGQPLTLYSKCVGKTPPEGRSKTYALCNPADETGGDYEHTKRSPLYFDRAKRAGHKDIVLVEGVTDAALAQVRGETNVVACVAAELSRDQVATLARHRVESVTIALDPDQAGEGGIRSCVRNLLPARIAAYVAPQLPDGMDPDDFIQAEGVEAWRQHIKQAVHAFRWKARQIIADYKPADGWTDRAQDAVLRAANEFAAAWPVEHTCNLQRFFWPEIAAATGADARLLAEQAGQSRATQSNGKAHAEPRQDAKPAVEPAKHSSAPADKWPSPPESEAYHGLAGDIVRAIEPHSEADPAALLVQSLVAFGSAAGRTAHFRVEGDCHYLNEFAVLVGKSSKARKGTSWGQVARLMEGADQEWLERRTMGGASSAEGVIHQARDPVYEREKVKGKKGDPVEYQDVLVDPGEEDKRVLLLEPEFANVLKQAERQGNTLSVILRRAWESGDIKSLTKHSPTCCTGGHFSLIGHITADELRRYLTATEVANGLGNRHLYVCVKRSKELPEGSRPDSAAIAELQSRLARSLAFTRTVGEMRRDDEARTIWREIYGELSGDRPGIAGCLLARAEAHVMRLAMIYAVMDCSPAIGAEHLTAALSLWDYCERSVRYVFGDSVGDPLADELLRMIRGAGADGLSRTKMSGLLGRNKVAADLGRALGVLLEARLAHFRSVEPIGGVGRPSEVWFSGAAGT